MDKLRWQLSCVALLAALASCTDSNRGQMSAGRHAPPNNPGAASAASAQAVGNTPYDTYKAAPASPGLLGMLGRSEPPAQKSVAAERRRPAENAAASSASATLPSSAAASLLPPPGAPSLSATSTSAPVGAVNVTGFATMPEAGSTPPATETMIMPTLAKLEDKAAPAVKTEAKVEMKTEAKKEEGYPSLGTVPPAPEKALSMKADKPDVQKKLEAMKQDQASAVQSKKEYFEQGNPEAARKAPEANVPPTAAPFAALTPVTETKAPEKSADHKALTAALSNDAAPGRKAEAPPQPAPVAGMPWMSKAEAPAAMPTNLPPTAAKKSVPVENQAVAKATAEPKVPMPDMPAPTAKFESDGSVPMAVPVAPVQAAPVKLISAPPQLATAPEAPRGAMELRAPAMRQPQPIGLNPAAMERRQARVLPESRYAARRAMINARLHESDNAAR